jgi:hypothetical protein
MITLGFTMMPTLDRKVYNNAITLNGKIYNNTNVR